MQRAPGAALPRVISASREARSRWSSWGAPRAPSMVYPRARALRQLPRDPGFDRARPLPLDGMERSRARERGRGSAGRPSDRGGRGDRRCAGLGDRRVHAAALRSLPSPPTATPRAARWPSMCRWTWAVPTSRPAPRVSRAPARWRSRISSRAPRTAGWREASWAAISPLVGGRPGRAGAASDPRGSGRPSPRPWALRVGARRDRDAPQPRGSSPRRPR